MYPGDGRKEPSKLKLDVDVINLTSWVSAWSVHMGCTYTEEADVKRYVILGSPDVIDKDHLFFC